MTAEKKSDNKSHSFVSLNGGLGGAFRSFILPDGTKALVVKDATHKRALKASNGKLQNALEENRRRAIEKLAG